MNSSIFAVYGAGGFGRCIMPIAREQLQNSTFPDQKLVFVDDFADQSRLSDHGVLSFEDFKNIKCENKYVVIAISSPTVRKQIAKKCEMAGFEFWSVISNNAVIYDDAKIGRGAIICAFSVVTTNVTIGDHCHLNLRTQVEHDSVLDDFVTLSPGAICNGNVHLEDEVFIGSGAILKNGTKSTPLVVEKQAVVGMGTVVLSKVRAGVTVVGNPAREMKHG